MLSDVVIEGGDKAERLLIVSKPRGQVTHRGGQIVSENDKDAKEKNGDTCMVSWLQGEVDKVACANAAKLPKE